MSWASRQELLVRLANRHFDAVSVIWGGVQGEGLLRLNSQAVVNGEIIEVDAVIENLPFDLFGTIKHGDEIVAGGVNYAAIHDALRLGDGAYCRLPVKRLDPEEGREVIIWGGGAGPITTNLIYSGGGA
jgi:phospholipid N-methyltransferase